MSEVDKGSYADLLMGIKARVQTARVRAGLSVNRELILLYWDIGTDILQRQHAEGWGAQIVDRLSRDIKTSFPGLTGFSARNLKYMRSFAAEYPDRQFVQQAVAQIPWGHILHLLQKVKEPDSRLWYIEKTIEHGWSRNILALHIDLKPRSFVAEDAGKMNFYLNAVDDQLRHPDDQPSLGLVLCREKKGSNKMLLEYALRGLDKPVGVSAYQLTPCFAGRFEADPSERGRNRKRVGEKGER